MIAGQGRPHPAPAASAWPALGHRLQSALALCLAAAAAWGLNARAVRAETFHVRVEWGGGAARVWEGTVAAAHGAVADPRALGIEADEPGEMWLRDSQLVIRQPSVRTYDGVDLEINAPADDQLLVQLRAAGEPPGPPQRIALGEILQDSRNNGLQNIPLDRQGNRLLVRRAPGDKLLVHIQRRSLIFGPGEIFRLEVRPNLLPVAAGAKLRLAAQLVDVHGSAPLWTTEVPLKDSPAEAVPLEVPLPSQEGVYEIVLAASLPVWQHALRSPLSLKPLAERRVQVLVLGPRAPAAHGPAPAELTRVVEIDPANPHWWERITRVPQLPMLARLRHGSLGNGNVQMRQHTLGMLAQLNPNRRDGEASWEAYWLPVARPGTPHVLEIDYPSDVLQTVGVSIIEPNAAGAVTAANVDSGFDVTEPPAAESGPPRWLRHRIVFWPRSKLPIVLVSNRSDHAPAVYGKIRVLAGWEQLPRAFAENGPPPQRVMAAYLDRPLFTQNFSASETLDGWSGRSLQDWLTFYEGAARLVEYLHYAGSDALMLSVMADGSTIYPSAVVSPTPRYDTGVLLDSGQDPLRKDVLGMLLAMFDRQRLQLVPALEFAAPLPELEAILRRGGVESEGLQWVGPDGAAWSETTASRRSLGPHYNVLDPRVQEAMLTVVREVVRSYADHPSLAGLALQLSADGYAQLPGVEWGLDDATIARFEHDANLRLPVDGAARYLQRARALTREPLRRTWLQWRADQLHNFYRRVFAELAAVRPGCRLFLAGANMLTGPDLQYTLRPTLPRRTSLAETLLELGLDVRHYQQDPDITLLESDTVAPLARLGAQAGPLEVRQMADAERCFQDQPLAGALFFHQPQRLHLASFDEKCPYHPAYTDLAAQLVPSGRENRRRFIHALAQLDPTLVFDGGWLLPLGQEETLHDLLAVYRQLPAMKFARLTDSSGGDAAQPLAIRLGNQSDRTYAYLVNDAGFAASLRVRVQASAGCRIEELTGTRKISALQHDDQGAWWNIDLEPYDLVAVTFSEPGVRLVEPVVKPDRDVESQLAARIQELSARAQRLANPPPLKVLGNPGFERPTADDGSIPGWSMPAQPGGGMHLDAAQKRSGNQSLRFFSSGPPVRVLSEPFDAPRSGRLSVSVWLRVADQAQQPPLRLALEGRLDGEEYYRFAPLGRPLVEGQPAATIGTQWAQYVVPINDLPLDGLTQVRVRFDLLGQGEVWIDDVQLYDLDFSRKERIELTKLVALADVKLQNNQWGDCVRLLEGYWPRFLETSLSAAPGEVADDAMGNKHPAATPASAPPERAGLLDRMKDAIPKRLRF